METVSVPFRLKYSLMNEHDVLRELERGDALTIIAGMKVEVEVLGFVRLEADAIVVEFRELGASRNAAGGDEAGATVRRVRIPLSAVDSIAVKRSWMLRPWLIIELNRLDVMPAMRWSDGASVVLPLKWRNRTRGRALTVTVLNQLADRQLARLGEC